MLRCAFLATIGARARAGGKRAAGAADTVPAHRDTPDPLPRARRRVTARSPDAAGGLPRPGIPLVISPHGRGVDERSNGLLWGDLPGEGGFAVINPAGEGRRLHWFSWGAPGEIADLARMPQIVERLGVHVDPHRIYAFGGSMGGQETLLLVATAPASARRGGCVRPGDRHGAPLSRLRAPAAREQLQRLAREEIGGTPAQLPSAYAIRSPDHYADAIAAVGVPLQLYWSHARPGDPRSVRGDAGAR